MTKKIVLLLFLVGGILAGFYLAQEKSGGVHAAVAVDRAEVIVPRTSTAMYREKASSSREANAQLDNPSLRVDQVLALLNDRARKIYSNTWIHIKEERIFDIDVPNNGVLPNGEVIPLHQVNDIWYYVNAAGRITATITIMHDEKGHVVQVGLCKDGVSWNSATKQKGSCEPTPLSLDGGFQQEVQWLTSKGAFVEKEEKVALSRNNKVGYRVVLTQEWELPLRADAYEKGITRAIDEVLFDTEDAHLVEWKTIFQFEDGSERVYRRVTWKVSVGYLSPEAKKFLAILP